jgi:hypothetical protein
MSESYKELDTIKLAIESACAVLNIPVGSHTNLDLLKSNEVSARQTINLASRKLRECIHVDITDDHE